MKRDLFESDGVCAYWEARETKSYVVRLGYYPRGCWVTGAKVTRPKETVTMYVKARNEEGAIRAAKRWAYIVHRYSVSKLLVDHVRYLNPQDLK